MIRFEAEFDGGYRVRVNGEPSGLWMMTVMGGQGPVAQFSNVYATPQLALRDAELFASYVLQPKGRGTVSAVRWRRPKPF